MIKKKAKLSPIERKYCSCVVKVRGKTLKNPYGICTKSVYGSRKKKRTKKVGCLKNLDIKKLSKNQLKGIILEKKINTNSNKKTQLINILNKYLKAKY
jgi:hypothetical protein